MLFQAMCTISLPYMTSNWSYSPETAQLGFDLCDLDLWPWPFARTSLLSMDITSVHGDNSWKFYDDGNMVKKGVTDGRTEPVI